VTVPVACTDNADVSCFGSVDSATRRPSAMLINRSPRRPADITLTIRSNVAPSAASVYRFDATDLKNIVHRSDTAIIAGKLRLTLPGYSITLVRCR